MRRVPAVLPVYLATKGKSGAFAVIRESIVGELRLKGAVPSGGSMFGSRRMGES